MGRRTRRQAFLCSRHRSKARCWYVAARLPGIHRAEDKLQPISWEEWFEKFDERKLALVYQEETADGEKSNFNKLISRDSES